MNIFERAARAKLRFDSSVGMLTTEDLFELPLTSRKGASLDDIARGVYGELKDIGEISFVEEKPNSRKTELELALELVKHVIESKKADKAAAEARVEKAARRQMLLKALDEKKTEALKGMSEEDIRKELAETKEDAVG